MWSAFKSGLETIVLVALSSTLTSKKNADKTKEWLEMTGGSMAADIGVEHCVMTTSNVCPAGR